MTSVLHSITHAVFPIFSSSNQTAAFLKNQNMFSWLFSLFFFDCSANELSAGRCFFFVFFFLKAPALLDLLCEEMFSVEIGCGKIEQGKNNNFLNPFFSVFPFLCLCFDSSLCDGVSHTALLQPTCPRSIVLLASFWTCAAINTVRCFLSEAGLREDVFCDSTFLLRRCPHK